MACSAIVATEAGRWREARLKHMSNKPVGRAVMLVADKSAEARNRQELNALIRVR